MKSKTFSQTGPFTAVTAAEEYLRKRGFTVGQMQGDAPRGIRLGDCNIPKWRSLTTSDIRALHGAITGNSRNGPITVDLFDTATPEACRAFAASDEMIAECV